VVYTKQEKQELKEFCKKYSLNMSEWVRQLIKKEMDRVENKK
jgi:hypothetical protein